MNPERFNLLQDLFHQAVELAPDARDAFLVGACQGDAALEGAVRKLLAADQQASPMARAEDAIRRVVTATIVGDGEAPGDRIDRYLLKEAIGEGGFGVVYRAEQLVPVRREVALKVIKLGMDTRQVISRFEAERQALAMMTHAGIATVLDAGATPTGRPYFVMELVRGEPITSYSDAARLTVRRRLELFVNVCDAIQHAHQKGIIHRDLKPSNVLVAEPSDEGDQPLPKIIDFGIAKATSARLTDVTIHTEFRQFIGTPEYMSPEQAGGSAIDIDTRSDIYSLGVLLYELLTGVAPFESRVLRSASAPDLQRIVREMQPVRPSSRVAPASTRRTAVGSTRRVAGSPRSATSPVEPESSELIAHARCTTPATLRRQLRGDLDWIILKCLEKERERRYHTAHDLAVDIRRYLCNQPVMAGPPSVRYRLRKFVRRHRGAFVAATLVVMALVAGLSFATYGLVRARQQRNMAVTALQFVEEVIAAPDPNRGNSAGITVADTLALASNRIDRGDLRDQIEVQARIRRMLGSTYMAMGLYDKAAPELEHALRLAERAFGKESRQSGMAWNDVGELNRLRGDFERAEEAYKTAMHIQSRLPRDMPAAQTFNNLGLLKQARGEFEEAFDLQRNALEMRLALFGTDNAEVATSYNNLGALTMAMGDFVAAEDYYRHALEMRLRLLEPGHWRVASTQLNLSRALVERGELVEADRLATEALENSRLALGEMHTQVGRAFFTVGIIRHAQHRYPEAEELLRTSLQTQRQAMPEGHPEIAHSLTGLGELLISTRRFREAEDVMREAVEIRRAKFAPDHPLLGVSLSVLGEAVAGQGRLDEAEPLLIEGQRVIEASRYIARSQRVDAIRRLITHAHTRGDAAAEKKWRSEAEKIR